MFTCIHQHSIPSWKVFAVFLVHQKKTKFSAIQTPVGEPSNQYLLLLILNLVPLLLLPLLLLKMKPLMKKIPCGP